MAQSSPLVPSFTACPIPHLVSYPSPGVLFLIPRVLQFTSPFAAKSVLKDRRLVDKPFNPQAQFNYKVRCFAVDQ